MDKIISGVLRFQKDEFAKRKDLFAKLATGQSPDALFIGCSDSRIDPSLITQSEPGDLIVCRNAGNIVPPRSVENDAMMASIEFAVCALNIPTIIICGHSNCGAMQGALNPDSLDEMPHVRDWLKHVEPATRFVMENCTQFPESVRVDTLIRGNVILQMNHLRQYPFIKTRIASGKLTIHGWVYDIETAAS